MRLLQQLKLGHSLGEGVLWHPLQQAFWWTDIHASQLYRYHPGTDQLDCWPTPDRLTAFGFTPDADKLIVSFAAGMAFYWPGEQRVQWLARPEEGISGNRFNDGRVSPAGHFWAGTLVEEDHGQQAALYRFDGKRCEAVITGLQIANGLCWSPDGSRCYHADSPTGTISVYRHDMHTGQLSTPQVFARMPEGVYPDGACVDAAGNLWSAQWGGGCVACYSPEGELLQRLELPASQVSCVAFGGPDLDWLIVTTARENMTAEALTAEPAAGDVFIFQAPYRGLPCAFFPA